jgi:hypothetical protein
MWGHAEQCEEISRDLFTRDSLCLTTAAHYYSYAGASRNA